METNPPADEPNAEISNAQTAQAAQTAARAAAETPSETPEAAASPGIESVSGASFGEAETGEGFEDAAVDENREAGTAGIAGTAAEGTGEAQPTDELSELADASQKARLAPVAEERMGELLRGALLAGRAGVARAIEALPRVPWIVGVRVVEAVWPELTAGFRTQLLAGLAKDDTDAAKRLRLSLARALFKLDVPVALKVAVGVVKELRDKETGALGPRQAQIFANVFIGRARPWLAQLPLGELKPGDAELIANCALVAVFTVPHPPLTQLGVLKWAQENGRLEKLRDAPLDAVQRGLGRWSGKWQSVLRKELPELPEELAAALKPAEAARSPQPRASEREEPDDFQPETAAAEAGSEPVRGEADADEEREDRDEDEAPTRRERPIYEPRPQSAAPEEPRERERPRERPVYTPRNAPANAPQSTQRFNLGDALRQIELHVQSLRNELAAAQGKLREKDDDRRRRPERAERLGPIIEGAPTSEELARLNQQLEARNGELQARIAEMAQHSEDVATSTGAMSGEPVSDADAQLRTLLGLKLQEDFADFVALEKESNDLVVQQHYKGLLRHVFEVLEQLAVPLKPE